MFLVQLVLAPAIFSLLSARFSLLCHATPVRVALEASFTQPPFITELLETAAEENSTAYYPLLDRIANGYFNTAQSDEELYKLFVRAVVDDGHICGAETLSSFDLALSLHSAAPRIEAHHQFYATSVEPLLKRSHASNCSIWFDFGGRRYCDLTINQQDGYVGNQNARELPFDRVLGPSAEGASVVLYADISSPEFGRFHLYLSDLAKNRGYSYRVRYRPPQTTPSTRLTLSGYGVELALKRTDYIVIDDRDSTDESSEEKASIPAKESSSGSEVPSLRPIPASELLALGMKASSYIMNSEDPFSTLQQVTQDFPLRSSALSAYNVSTKFLEEHQGNRELLVPSGYTVLWINGVQIDPRQVDGFSLLGHLRKERRLVDSIRAVGFTGPEAINLLSHSALAEAQTGEEPERYDYRDDYEGGGVIMWLNDVEKDKRYSSWPTDISALLQRTYPGQLPAVRKDIHNTVIPVDLTELKDVAIVVETIQAFVKRGVPVRFGLVPLTSSVAAADQARILYFLLDTYGLGTVMDYLKLIMTKKNPGAPVKTYYESIVNGRKPRLDRIQQTFEDVLTSEISSDRITRLSRYLTRLSLKHHTDPVLVNGVAIPRTDEWLQLMSNRVSLDLRSIQQLIFEEKLRQEDHIPSYFLSQASHRRNALIIPEDEKSIRSLDLDKLYQNFESLLTSLPHLRESETVDKVQCARMMVIADFSKDEGIKLLTQAALFRQKHENLEILFVPSTAGESETQKSLEKLKEELSKALKLNIPDSSLSEESLGVTDFPLSAEDLHLFLLDLGLRPGQGGLLVNGRIVGPIDAIESFEVEDFESLLQYEEKKRIAPCVTALRDLDLSDRVKTPLTAAKICASLALSLTSDVPEGIFETPSPVRLSLFNKWNSSHTAIVTGDIDSASVQIVATVDPATETAQKWVPLLKIIAEMGGVHMRLFLNPKEKLQELPVKRFYRSVLEGRPTFQKDGRLRRLEAAFATLPEDTLLTMAMDVPPSWLVAPKDCIQDLDNIRLDSLKEETSVEAIYELKHILIEGHSRDVVNRVPPRGTQLVLGTEGNPHSADTIVMANLGYFQFKANPGFYKIALQEGRSEQIFEIESVGSKGYSPQPGDKTTNIALTSFQGLTLFPRLSRKPGQEDEDVLESHKSTFNHILSNIADFADNALAQVGLSEVRVNEYLSKAVELGSSVLSKTSISTNMKPSKHAEINIFSVASGHLYERMLNIMILSVMKNTNHTVKFWFIEQFLSPSFKSFLPTLAYEYNFDYEMVMYKWPHWLRAQKEKQRVIWGYKILFLDVLFPLDLDKVIFVDADQIVRTDMYELVTHDLKGAPYGFTPMCDSRTEMEGFRFWKQGYWKNFLRGLPYHISALYVVDLRRFRQIAAGDRLRQQYHQLSADPNSLSNLDQDLPNNMQMTIPIHSLPQEWLWCETWCSDESLKDAKTIDLCNNPLTKEPKLDRARRQVPEWTVYDEEIAALARRAKDGELGKGRQLAADSLTAEDISSSHTRDEL